MNAPTHLLQGSGTITVDASPDDAYDFVSDLSRLSGLSPECHRCEWQNGVMAAEVGAVFVGHNKVGDREWSTVCQVIAADRGHRFAFEVGMPDRKFTRWSYDFEPTENGGAQVIESFHIVELPPPLAAADPAERRARVGELEDGVRQTLVRLQEALSAPVVRPGDGTCFTLGDAVMTIKARGGADGVTVIEWVSPAGGTAPLHIHHDLDDSFYVLDGEVTLWCGNRISHAGPGSYVSLPRGIPHSIYVEGDRPLRALLVHANDQFADFVAEASAARDHDELRAIAERTGQEIVGPPPFTATAPQRNQVNSIESPTRIVPATMTSP